MCGFKKNIIVLIIKIRIIRYTTVKTANLHFLGINWSCAKYHLCLVLYSRIYYILSSSKKSGTWFSSSSLENSSMKSILVFLIPYPPSTKLFRKSSFEIESLDAELRLVTLSLDNRLAELTLAYLPRYPTFKQQRYHIVIPGSFVGWSSVS